MKFYFPDSQDLVSPSYDFQRDEYSPLRVRQRDDWYAHEALSTPPYDGILVSKAIVDGSVKGAGKYSVPQRERLYRLGVRRFFRLPPGVSTLGDCGAFNYLSEPTPPYSVEEVLDFYLGCGFDAGVSVDHVVLGYHRDALTADTDPDWSARRRTTLRLAERFISAVQDARAPIEPVGAAQGWSPASYADSVQRLQRMGYRRIALGGMVPLKTRDIRDCLRVISDVREPTTELHLLGVTRVEAMDEFASHGVTSFDSTSAFRQAFMDDRKNYHTPDGHYVAIRVPQVDGNAALKRRILAGHASQRAAQELERECLKTLRGYQGQGSLRLLDLLEEYEELSGSTRRYRDQYERTLTDQPWRQCRCDLCARHGVEIIIFRGTERNKRRGFHNLHVFADKVRHLQTAPAA